MWDRPYSLVGPGEAAVSAPFAGSFVPLANEGVARRRSAQQQGHLRWTGDTRRLSARHPGHRPGLICGRFLSPGAALPGGPTGTPGRASHPGGSRRPSSPANVQPSKADPHCGTGRLARGLSGAGRSVRLPPPSAASGPTSRRLMTAPLDWTGRDYRATIMDYSQGLCSNILG